LKANGFRVVAKGKFRIKRTPKNISEFVTAVEESERLAKTKVRVGAGALRKFVLRHREICEVTDVSEPELLRVSHIVSWSEDEKCRRDPDNVILLSCLWDAAFDRGLVSFDDSGCAIFAKSLTPETRKQLISSELKTLAMNHSRAQFFFAARSNRLPARRFRLRQNHSLARHCRL